MNKKEQVLIKMGAVMETRKMLVSQNLKMTVLEILLH